MSDPNDPKKKQPPATEVLKPEDMPDFEKSSPAPAEESPPPDPAAPEAKQPQATIAWDPEKASEMQAAAAAQDAGPPGGDEEEEEDPLIGTLVRDKWKVLKRLGAGSFGTVYKVQDVKGGWIEALKILGVERLTGAEGETTKKRFLREAQIMKRLGTESQHIVGLSTYEEDFEAGLIYFLMEHVEGKHLGDVLEAEGPFPVERTIRLALQVCDALVAAHEGPEPVVHRDLKLENLMLTVDRAGEDFLKVLDFGIAKLAETEADSRLTTVGTLGTPGYAAPEQLRAEDVDGRTDLFALGVILYALLTGRDPWLGRPANEPTHQIYDLMVATERSEVKPMAETGVDVPPAMANLVMRLLRRDPDERFPSARELAEALKRIAAGGEEADVGSLRVLTDEPGVQVQIRAGRRVVAEGPTPCVGNGLAAGTYKVLVRDPRFQPLETSVTLSVGALEDLTLVTTPVPQGLGARILQRKGLLATAALVVILLAGAAVVQPWGRTLDLADLQARVADGSVTSAWVADDGIQGQFAMGPIPAPFRVQISEEDLPGTVENLRSAGLDVDTSWEVARLIGLAASAQSQTRYFGGDGDDVRGYAERATALEPDSPEAMSLLLKVAERMAWDVEAAIQDGDSDAAEALVSECLAMLPEHPGCTAAGGEG
ncbi:serine/threonine-protein kinase [Gemmatimonadota bacterium]